MMKEKKGVIHMEVRPTKMLTEKELREDLGISRDQLLNFIVKPQTEYI